MQVKTVVMSEDGPVEFTAELTEKEVPFVLEVGLNYLLKSGVISLTQEENEDKDSTIRH